MKRILMSTILVLSLLIGAIPASAAVKENKVVWLGDYGDAAWKGVNLTTVDGKNNVTKRVYKDDAYFPTLVGDWIYFLKQETGSDVIMGQIVKVKTDGSQLSEVTKDNTYSGFSVDGNIIYFGGYDKDYNYEIGSMNLDGTGKKILLPKLSFWSYVVGKGYVFYVDTNSDQSLLYRMKFDGSGKTAISKKSVQPRDGGYSLFENTLFYAEEPGADNKQNWYLLDISGTNKKTFTSKGTISPVGYQNKHFFFEESVVNASKKTIRTLTKINRDGSQKKTITTLAEGDQFIGSLGTTFVYKTTTGKVYQIGQDGKLTKSSK
ncbi:DUF5050 domain-containing protein [Paenibacillus glacialis]|uniref:Prolow-density lipoprotein receptor-related protein 1-like beta-propeller domain-containing protein n=1 Tax=Paenibacillus glacialis TaxID=494026 RepID=A0A168DL68_9BACL|nr:DUF5050 domain-containing protein [Paenibacillus glacialis]OAB34310.1 hypothetical protein PGLA_22775 [Paenibacillus glacialis]